MAIGIQNNNARLPLPGTGESPNGPGRSLSETALNNDSGQQSVDNTTSAPAGGQQAPVQLNFSGTSALYQALLAGDRTSSAPTNNSQDLTAPTVQGTDLPTAGANAPGSGSWIPQALARQVTQMLGLAGGLGSGLLDGSFMNTTREFASALLTGASARPARIVPVSTAGNGLSDGEAGGTADAGQDKLSLLVDLLTDMTPGLTEAGKAQLKRLGHAVKETQKTFSESDFGGRLQAAQPKAMQAQATQLMERGFTFQIEMRQSVQVDATVAQLNENGFQAVRVQASSESVTRIQVTVGGKRSDPVVLDLDRDGEIGLSAPGAGAGEAGAGQGQAFDINGDGREDKTSFVKGGDAFLALDRNGNGAIDDGTELFGDQRGAQNGMAELARLDANGDGKITASDPLFGQLSAFFDINGDGKVGKNEFKPISELGIAALNLNAQKVQIERADGNALSAKGVMEYADGSKGLMADADLTFQ